MPKLADEINRRLSAGVSLRTLAASISTVSYEALRLIATGKRQPSPETARGICNGLGLDPEVTLEILHELRAKKQENIDARYSHVTDSTTSTAYDARVERCLLLFTEHAEREMTPELENFLRLQFATILRSSNEH